MKHLKTLESLNLISEKKFGRIWIYRYNIENPKARSLKKLIEIFYPFSNLKAPQNISMGNFLTLLVYFPFFQIEIPSLSLPILPYYKTIYYSSLYIFFLISMIYEKKW